MGWQLALSVIVGSVWISAIAASTPGNSDTYLEERSQLVGGNCSSPMNASATCWNQLQIPTYLAQWSGAHPTCETGANETECCISGEPWSTCFMRVAYAFDSTRYAAYGMNCTGFHGCTDPLLAPTLPDGITIQEFYVLNNIYVINVVFSELNDCELSTRTLGKDAD